MAPLRPVGSEAEAARGDGVTPPSVRGGSRRFLTDVIVDLGLVPRERVEEAVQAARGAGRPPEQLLLEQGALTADQLARAVAERFGLDHLDLSVFEVDMTAANAISLAAAKRYSMVPVRQLDERTLLVAMEDPSNVVAIDDLALRTGLTIKPAVASREDIAAVIARLNRLDTAIADAVEDEAVQEADVTELHAEASDTPVVKLVNSIIAQAVEQGASDIHFEPAASELRVRFRIDGVLVESTVVPRRMAPGVVSRIKIMAELDISERRLPQDGRVALRFDGRQVDIRVVTLPSVHGESVVLRVLDKEGVAIELPRLGMRDDDLRRFERAVRQSHGATLVTGPTGSGKSTTLYAAVGMINSPEKNIITIEDPVEYQVDGITQVQVNPKAGLTFATGLRSMMRADPDVIMVGEVRDRETAQIAIESALTGHLVLTTLHTNDAPTAITRLVEMGIEPFLVASAVDCVVAQRLARVLCTSCKRRTLLSAELLREHGFAASFDVEAYEPVGCARCSGTGYRGRIGLFEVMDVSARVRELALRRASADEVAAVAIEEGMRTLRDDGLDKLRSGLTSIDEVVRVIGSA
ncbi:MAG TPA: ATPase, T2SS/T4P/T4SS family [Capillimicrobium sp.]|nr:ATPase, T2SS/T4P/T4SS family [Capillimicrobium sp.]